jgi:hypothetical protein
MVRTSEQIATNNKSAGDLFTATPKETLMAGKNCGR